MVTHHHGQVTSVLIRQNSVLIIGFLYELELNISKHFWIELNLIYELVNSFCVSLLLTILYSISHSIARVKTVQTHGHTHFSTWDRR